MRAREVRQGRLADLRHEPAPERRARRPGDARQRGHGPHAPEIAVQRLERAAERRVGERSDPAGTFNGRLVGPRAHDLDEHVEQARHDFDPLGAATGFGASLAAASDAFYLHVKADRDLAIAAAIFGLLAYRRATPLAILVGAMLIAPIGDALLVIREGRIAYALAVHGSAVAYGVVLVRQLRAAYASPPS